MGQQTLELWGGGGQIIATGSQTLRWWLNRRVQTIRAPSAGQMYTLQDASEYQMPFGFDVLIIINPVGATNSFTLASTNTPTFSFSVAAGTMVHISRVLNSSGVPCWAPGIRTILT